MSDNTQAPSLGVQDLQAVLNMIEIANSRGAFKGAELSSVGQLFDKINTFVVHFLEQQEATGVDNSSPQQDATPGEVQ
jgi:hypothetical protein